MSEETYYVVKAKPCERFLPEPLMAAEWCERFQRTNDRCEGCLHNGTRAVLDTASEVELVDVTCDWDGTLEFATYSDPHPQPGDYYRICEPALPTREDNNQ